MPVVVFALLLPGILPGQETAADISSVTGNLRRYIEANPYEEVYLHTDRERYAAGEKVRMNAWLFTYPDLQLAAGNSYVYAELLDYYGLPVSQAIIRTENGTGESHMTLPDTLVTGSYLLRAYTSIGRNYLPYGCFMKRITVANPFRSGYLDYCTGQKSVNDQPYQVRFYPEGGRMVNGIPSVTGFLALNRYGYPVRCEATVVNGRGEPVALAEADNTGTGSFVIIPERGETYSLVTAGTGLRFDLPAASDSGITMQVRNEENKTVHILLRARPDSLAPVKQGGFILVRSRGRLHYSRELPAWETMHEISIPASGLNEGLVNIACFDRDGRFTAERFIMLPAREEQKMILDIKGERGRRQKVIFEISLAADSGGTAEGRPGSVSVSAVSSGERSVSASEYLLSGSEFYNDSTLPGLPVLPPGTDQKTADRYLLGIKSVWIDWEKLASGSQAMPVFPAEAGGRYLTVRQTVSPPLPEEDKRIAYLTSWGRIRSLQYAESDPDGRFRFFLEEKNDPEEILIRTKNGTRSLPLKTEPFFSEERIIHPFTPDTSSYPPADKETGRITDRYQIEKIYGITDSLKAPAAETGKKEEPRFYGVPDQEINLDDYISLTSMREIFFELVKRVVVRSDRDGEGVQIWDPVLRRSPALFIDQVPVDEAETVLGLDPARVQRIDVISGDYLLGEIIFPGIVSVITRKGTYGETPLPPGALRTPFRMYDPAEPFTIPGYGEDELAGGRIPDFRNTVFWKSDLRSDSSGKFRCEFRSSDDAGDYEITVNVIDGNGRPVSLKQKISFTGL